MDALRPEWYLICLSVLLVIAGFVGVGGAQQTPVVTTTANTTTTAGGTTGGATITSTMSTQPQTAPDANDGWQNATPIDTNRTVNETLPAGDQDWSVFTLDSSGSITVRLAAANRTNLSGFLYNNEGDLLDSSYVPPGEQVSLSGEATAGGEYYVFIRSEADSLGAYAFNVSVGESGTASAASGENQPQTAAETSSSSGPGFTLLAGVGSIIVGIALLIRTAADSR